MALGPIEVLVLAFPESKFTGLILPQLARLVESETISIIDGLLVRVDAGGNAAYFEFDELGANDDVSSISALMARVDGLISDEDVRELTASLDPGSSGAILVFEHTWAKPLRDAVVASGGILVDSIRVPGEVVDEVLAAVSELD